MIQQLKEVHDNMVAFKATGDITKEDFESKVIPAVNELVKRTGNLNYMLIVDTPLKNFTAGAWWKDALLGIKNVTKWNRAAIVTDSKSINTFTDLFSVIMPGEFKGFTHNEIDSAISWVSNN